MRKIVIFLLAIVAQNIFCQTEISTKIFEYSLPPDDCNSGTFYLGRFSVGCYEISANIQGTHANNCGWKVIVGRQWGISKKVTLKEVYNNISGEFVYQNYSDYSFDLWWDAKSTYTGYNWTPIVKVECPFGTCNYQNDEPSRGNGVILEDYQFNSNALTITPTGKVGIGMDPPSTKLDIDGNITASRVIGKTLSLDHPNNTEDWNAIWQCGFFQACEKDNAPESNGWFWGLNLGHTSNRSDYRYGGQIAIRNSASNPIMYFRSRTKDGSGTWAKVLHNKGNQEIDGNLTVKGTLNSEEVKVEIIAANNITYTANGQTADHVFEEDYNLRSLEEIEAFVKANKHLPEIPSASAMEEEGVNLPEMNKLLLQKVEELTLYIISQEKRIKELEKNK